MEEKKLTREELLVELEKARSAAFDDGVFGVRVSSSNGEQMLKAIQYSHQWAKNNAKGLIERLEADGEL